MSDTLEEEGRFGRRSSYRPPARGSYKRAYGRRGGARPWIFARWRPRPWIFRPPLAVGPLWPYPPAREPPAPGAPVEGGSPEPPAPGAPVEGGGGGAAPEGPEGAGGPPADAAAEPPADGPPPEAGDGQSAEPEPGPEQGEHAPFAFDRMPASARATGAAITSWRRVSLTSFPFTAPAGGGLYIIERAGAPLFVGQAQSFAAHWSGRLLGLYQMGLVERGRLGAPFPITVWFGALAPNTPAVRASVQQTLVRTLGAAGLGRALRNSRAPSVSLGLTIRGLLPPLWAARVRGVPGLRGNTLVTTGGARAAESR